MNIVLIIPTGIGATIGGHAGDANPVAKLFGTLCDNLITHPNVVNASDINEMPENTLYVEGSILDRFLKGYIYLEKVKNHNRILLAVNKPVKKEIVNAVFAARVTIGADIKILELSKPLEMAGFVKDNIATGQVKGHSNLIAEVMEYHNEFDALAISSPIQVDRETKLTYYKVGGINPWGGIEAITSKIIANGINKPVAHAPLEEDTEDEEIYRLQETVITNPRIAPEIISICYLHSVFKGLHKAPRISEVENKNTISNKEIDFLISPYGCYGPPHIACLENNIPIIVVKENKTSLNDEHKLMQKKGVIWVNNYWEAAGVVSCYKAGIKSLSVRDITDDSYLI